jgi:magnesium chelatase family protein
VDLEALNGRSTAERSESVCKRVCRARRLQEQRYVPYDGVHCNAQLQTRLLHEHASIGSEGRKLLRAASDRLGLSARAYVRILKVARTIADLDGHPQINVSHLSEAIQYRSLDREWWHG